MMGIPAWLLAMAGGVGAIVIMFLKYPWLKYDFKLIKALFGGILFTKKCDKGNLLICDLFESSVKKHPSKTFVVFQGKKYSFEYINSQANKVANLAQQLGWKRGDLVALLIYNEPAFIWTYLGLMKIGIQMPLLNFNLRSKSLQHCIKVNTNLRAIIVGQGDELRDAINEIYPELDSKPEIYFKGSSTHLASTKFILYDELFEKSSNQPIDRDIRNGLTLRDTLCYIYTSGTTGLPKAAVVTHMKGIKGAYLMRLCGVTENDVIYTPLPLYHSAAGLIALGTAICEGCTLVLRNKFSASQFWPDCRENNVTVVQYIGELCRYLVAQPKSDLDKDHRVRLAFGNGLRKDIFAEFQERYSIPQIGEFYAATEGNMGFINLFNKSGCIGRLSPFLSSLSKTYLIKYDYEKDEPMKDEFGKYIIAKPGEKGLCISQIKKLQEYDGYQGNRSLSEKKQIKDVFKKGDCFFNTGDILVTDNEYFLYFSDRIGDTYRWKGENVSTIEVGNVITDLDWIEDANVYGVEIPGQDGRCGMVSLTLTANHKEMSEKDLEALYRHCEDLLPVYARPRFLRHEKEAIITATFKQQKFALVKQGFNPELCKDVALYCMSPKDKTYVALDDSIYSKVISGEIRL